MIQYQHMDSLESLLLGIFAVFLGSVAFLLIQWLNAKLDLKSTKTESPSKPIIQQKIKAETLEKGSREKLDKCFKKTVFVHIIILTLSIALILFFRECYTWWIALSSGLFGSTLAAFRSLLDRRAQGLEDEHGNQSPVREKSKDKREGRYASNMRYWLLLRPVLGGFVGLFFFIAIEGSVLTSFLNSEPEPTRLIFYTILIGLFAKTALDVLLGSVKGVFNLK